MLGLLLGVCLNMPLFDDTGPVCTVAVQAEECRCTECMEWTPNTQGPGEGIVLWYEIERTDPGGAFGIVGKTFKNDWFDDDGMPQSAPAPTIWCFAHDGEQTGTWGSLPLEGQLYGYRVRACNITGCGGWSTGLEYTAAPYAINQFQPPVQGN